MFIPDYFELYELLPPDIYSKYHGHPQKLWGMFDDRLLKTLHNIRHRYGKMVMNTWHWGGQNKYRGWRPWNTQVGAELSQHKFGRAGDPVPVETSAEDIRLDILADPFHPDFKYITGIEMGVAWLHIDVRNWNKTKYGILKIYV
jgi:hypothetical protein